MSGRDEPRAAQHRPAKSSEITLRGVCLGAAITAVFMSANVYLGLKTGMTFSSSIPAAVISMSVLKLFGAGDVLENNIVQTQASAAGTLCNVNLVLPGLVLVGFWHGFPFWQTAGLCLLGGLFGVVYSVPLRRVMVVESELPFPEGVAAAEVLRSGHETEGRSGGLRELALSAAAAGLFNLATTGVRLLPTQMTGTLVLGHAAFRLGGSLSLALIGVGYLVRIGACLALLVGVALAWGVAVPVLTWSAPHADDPGALAQAVWSDKVRLIGAGVLAVGGLWTVVTLVKPIMRAFRGASAGRPAGADAHDKAGDVPPAILAAVTAALCVLTGALLSAFVAGTPELHWRLVPGTVALVAVLGFVMAAACGYMAALLGSSSSPISGIGILTVMLLAACFASVLDGTGGPNGMRAVVGLALFVGAFVVTVSSIANDNLQDLKTGHIVGATPWKQQIALAIGVVIGALTVVPALKVMYEAYGFPGAFPHPGMDPANAMPAPQAALIAQIADGIVHHRLAWGMVAIGAGLGVVFVVVEHLLRRRAFSLPALTVGIGMYLPCEVVLTIALGGVIGWLAERALARRGAEDGGESARRRGVLMASGFLVGESLVGVLIATADTLAGHSDSLALGRGLGALAGPTGVLVFAALLGVFYRATSQPSFGR